MSTADVRSQRGSPAGRCRVPPRRLAWAAAAALLVAAAAPALAGEPSPEPLPQLWRHGTVSRHFWAPQGLGTEVAGLRVSAGLAVGLRAPMRAAVGSRVAPAVVLHTGARSNLTLLPAEGGGAMLVWQLRD